MNLNLNAVVGIIFLLATIIFTFISPPISQIFAILFVGSAIHCHADAH